MNVLVTAPLRPAGSALFDAMAVVINGVADGGGIFSIIYLYIFNRVTRQSLHDLAVGTFVVNANSEAQESGEVWQPHLVIVLVFFGVAAAVPAFTGHLLQNASFGEMLAVQSALSSEQWVTYATVTTGVTTSSSVNEGAKTTTHVIAQAFLSVNKVSDAELAKKLAATVVQNYPEAVNKNTLKVVLTYGYDIGIWSQWSNHTYTFNLGERAGAE